MTTIVHNKVVGTVYGPANERSVFFYTFEGGYFGRTTTNEVRAIFNVPYVVRPGQMISRSTVTKRTKAGVEQLSLHEEDFILNASLWLNRRRQTMGKELYIEVEGELKLWDTTRFSSRRHVYPGGLATSTTEVTEGSKVTKTFLATLNGKPTRQQKTVRTGKDCTCCWTEMSDQTTWEDGQVVHVVTESSHRCNQLVEKTCRKEVDGLLVEETSFTDDGLGVSTEETRTFDGGLLVNRVKIVTQPMEACLMTEKTTDQFLLGLRSQRTVDTQKKFVNGNTASETVVSLYEGGQLRRAERTSNSRSVQYF